MLAVVLVGAVATVLGIAIHQSATSTASPSTGSPTDIALGPDATSVEQGGLPEGVTAFDEGYPGVDRLEPDLLSALQEATTAAAVDGVDIVINSGWRSREHQEQLMRDAIVKYGSAEEAARWVATPDTSAHVTGAGVDVGPFEGTLWLSEFGARYGLCQIYGNEPWHYELRPEAIDQGCPEMRADATHGPGDGH
ncbi:M15 family metallopeptidase [Diaminobutyricimonas aerilata]|nr:M15 family metallopeptidase [Diaminobutyricimonas aerilata]